MRFVILVLAWLSYHGLGDRVPNLPLLGQICLLVSCILACAIDLEAIPHRAAKASGRFFQSSEARNKTQP